MPPTNLSPASQDRHARQYMDYLRLLHLVEKATPELQLDASSERLLHWMAISWQAGSKITVVQAMHKATDMSTTTAHRRLKLMRQQGFIALETDAIDQRIKYVVPAEKSHRLFAQNGHCVTTAQG